jgi:hypothetical protein
MGGSVNRPLQDLELHPMKKKKAFDRIVDKVVEK